MKRKSSDRKGDFLQGLIVAQVAIILMIVIIEITFRILGYDFERKVQTFSQLPVYMRIPTLHIGEGFYRRPGPDRWEGQVLLTMLKADGGMHDAYIHEPRLTITYDKLGFRNPDDLHDWDVTIAGDSFTELGYLPYEHLFTSLIGTILKVDVKNLGVSHTSILTHTYYLRRYGKSPRTKHAILVLFEGNDLTDLLLEEERLLNAAFDNVKYKHHRTEDLPKQSSFLKAIYRMIRQGGTRRKKDYVNVNAYFGLASAQIPVTAGYTPPGTDQLSPGFKAMLEKALTRWSDTAKELGMKPWLVFMPVKRRVLDGYLTFTDNAKPHVINWSPTDLPELVQKMAEENDIRFINATPGLIEETKRGQIPYNTVYDPHLNCPGSLSVARSIATALAAEYRIGVSELQNNMETVSKSCDGVFIPGYTDR